MTYDGRALPRPPTGHYSGYADPFPYKIDPRVWAEIWAKVHSQCDVTLKGQGALYANAELVRP